MTALKMPKNTEEEKALRKTAMSQALKTASLVPFESGRTVCQDFLNFRVSCLNEEIKTRQPMQW